MSRSAPLDDKMRRALELWEKITDERLRGSVARAISANDFDLALSLAEARRPSAGVSNGLAAVAEEDGDEEAEAANGTYRQAAPPADAWACSACSFENHGGTHCAMCGTQRAGAPGRSRGAATLRGMASTPGTSGRRAGIVGGGLVAVAEDAGLVFEEEGEEEEGEEEDDDDQMLADLGMTPRGHNMPPANSHTILVIDNSASMKQRDVKNTDKRAPADAPLMRRCDALTATLTQHFFEAQQIDGANRLDLISCVRMEEGQAKVLCALTPFPEARAQLLAPPSSAQGGQATLKAGPRGEGFYLAVLEKVYGLGVAARKKIVQNACTTVLFFSDGRPSDPMERVVVAAGHSVTRRREADYATWISDSLIPKACDHVWNLWLALGADRRRLQFHCVGFGNSPGDFDVLRRLASRIPDGAGHFNNTRLDLYQLQSSIVSFSTSLTSTRTATASTKRRRELRTVHMKQFESRFTKYYKAKIYESPEPGLFGARATQIGEVDVEIADGAFESGGERNVFMMRFLRRTELFQTVPDAQGRQQQFKTFEAEASEEWVVKEDKHAKISDNNDLEFHDKSLVTQRTAAVLAEKFNELCEEKSLSVPKVKYLDAFLLVTTQPTRRQFFAERKLETTFQKWNTNNGTVVKSVRPAPPPPPPPAGADADGWSAVGGARRPGGDASWAGSAEYPAEEWELTDKVRTEHVPQAFSHWTMEGDGIDWAYMDEESGEERAAKLLVCDIQGCYVGERYEFQLNDPVIHSQAGERCMFGLTDHGTSGIMLFMKSHICNPLCRQLGLLNNSLFEEEKTAALFRSSRKTSDLTVQKVNHLRERQLQRAIRTRELQQARKHGVQERNHDGKLRHVGPNGVVYATDESGKIGITAFRREPEEASQGPSPAPARPLVPSPPPTASPPTSSPPATSTTPPPPPALAKPSKLEALLASKLPDKVKYIRSALGMEDDPSKKMAIKSTVDEAMELVGLPDIPSLGLIKQVDRLVEALCGEDEEEGGGAAGGSEAGSSSAPPPAPPAPPSAPLESDGAEEAWDTGDDAGPHVKSFAEFAAGYPPEQLEGDTLRLYNQYRMALEAVQRRAPASAAAAPEAPPPPPPALDAYEQGRERIIIRRVGAERGARGGPSRSYVRTFGAGEQGADDEDDEDDEDEGEAAEKEEASEARGSGESAAAARARKLADKRRRKKENAREKQRRALEEDALLQDRIREVEEEKLRQRIEAHQSSGQMIRSAADTVSTVAGATVNAASSLFGMAATGMAGGVYGLSSLAQTAGNLPDHLRYSSERRKREEQAKLLQWAKEEKRRVGQGFGRDLRL